MPMPDDPYELREPRRRPDISEEEKQLRFQALKSEFRLGRSWTVTGHVLAYSISAVILTAAIAVIYYIAKEWILK